TIFKEAADRVDRAGHKVGRTAGNGLSGRTTWRVSQQAKSARQVRVCQKPARSAHRLKSPTRAEHAFGDHRIDQHCRLPLIGGEDKEASRWHLCCRRASVPDANAVLVAPVSSSRALLDRVCHGVRSDLRRYGAEFRCPRSDKAVNVLVGVVKKAT